MDDFNVDKYSGLKEILQGHQTGDSIKLHDPPRKVKPLSHRLLRGKMRDYVIDKIKKPMMERIISLVSKYPEPTRENCLHPNTQKLLDIRDKFFEYENLAGRKPLFEAAFKLLIIEYEHDPYYRWRFEWLLEEINKSGWLPRKEGRPLSHWKEFEDAEKTVG